MHQHLIQLALDAGAAKAEILSTDQIVMAAEFREACRKNLCGQWNRCWMCPPDIGDIHALMADVRSYRYGLLYQTIAQLEDSFDFEGMQEAAKRHSHLSRRLEGALSPHMGRHLHLSCGGCRFCERCAKLDDLPCRAPEQALSSMEGYGIDVYSTSKATSLKYINGQNTVAYFAIVLF